MDRKTRQELHNLLSALLDGALTPGQHDRLGDLLRQHPAARDLYLAYFALHANLALRGETGSGAACETIPRPAPHTPHPKSPVPDVLRARRPRLRRRVAWVMLGLSTLAAGLFLALAYGRRPAALPTPQDQQAEPTHQTIAVLQQATGAEWEETGLPTRVGAPLPVGRLRLKSGFAQIEFYSGATVILQGPADLELISSREAYCSRGKLRATVPPQAQGFTVRSPKLDLVDRGTEFGLQVGDNGRTEVHVFQGKVEIHNPTPGRGAAAHQELTTGQGVRLDGSGTVRPIDLDPAAFLTAQGLAERSEAETQRRQQAWLAASRALRRDPGLLVYYTFEAEQPWSRTLLDQAGGRHKPHDGAVVGCSWVTGRWPGKQGLEFKRVSDRVRLHVPGAFESITLAAWVRVDALPNVNNSLFLTDGWEVGGLHWQIGEAGKLVLGVKAPQGTPNGHYHALDVFKPERFGQWIQLAVVYDRGQGRVTHYVDGRSADLAPVQFDVPLRIGDAEIGNWNTAARPDRQPIRNFSGCMDEFLIFSQALTDEDIRELYDQGKRWEIVGEK